MSDISKISGFYGLGFCGEGLGFDHGLALLKGSCTYLCSCEVYTSATQHALEFMYCRGLADSHRVLFMVKVIVSERGFKVKV